MLENCFSGKEKIRKVLALRRVIITFIPTRSLEVPIHVCGMFVGSCEHRNDGGYRDFEKAVRKQIPQQLVNLL